MEDLLFGTYASLTLGGAFRRHSNLDARLCQTILCTPILRQRHLLSAQEAGIYGFAPTSLVQNIVCLMSNAAQIARTSSAVKPVPCSPFTRFMYS
jgi:hypothetical protein